MKKILFTIIIILFGINTLPCLSQENPLWGMRGIKQGQNMFFAIDGIDISVITEKGNLKDKSINKVKKKYEFKNNVEQYSDTTLSQPNVVLSSIESTKKVPNSKIYKYCYIRTINETEIQFVCFQSTWQIAIPVRNAFMKLYFDNELKQYTTDNMRPTDIEFAGRKISVGNGFYWQYVNNLKSSDGGQINWSIFKSEDKAKAFIDYFIAKNDSPKGFKVLSHGDANIMFDGHPTIAIQFINQLLAPKFLIGPYNILIVYYVVQKIEDHYIACVLSHYTDSKVNDQLPYSLSLFMQLDESSDRD